MRICTFNCQGIVNESRFFELEEAWGKIKYDILGISETRMVGEKITKLSNGNYCYFGQTKWYRGTGFYINKKWGDKIVEVRGISERVSMLINYKLWRVAWRRDARDRKRWANVGEAYVLGRAHSGR